MNYLRLKELLLLSSREQRAKRVPFDPTTTLILGNNDTGKSSVLKSIYDTLGAAPARTHERWTDAEVITFLRFEHAGHAYGMLKVGKLFALFNSNDQPIKTFGSVTSELGPYLGEMLSFNLKLTNRAGEVITPPPAYCFLPFYVDQDAGWLNNWNSFAKLAQLHNWKASIAEYHTGIKPNEYYLAKAAKESLEARLEIIATELQTLEELRKHARRDEQPRFNVSLEAFGKEVDDLVTECSKLAKIEDALKEQLRELQDNLMLVRTKISIVDHALAEIAADYQYATYHLPNDEVSCPTCGALYDNSFRERFRIAEDEDRLQELLIELRREQQIAASQLAEHRTQFSDNRQELYALRALLETSQQDVTLASVLQSEGRKEVDAIFEERIADAAARRNMLLGDIESYRNELRKYEDTQRRNAILTEYQGLMRKYLHDLKVEHLSERTYRRIDATIKEIGSDLPRALLAYYFSILRIIQARSTSTFCPIVIDSPNQQAQDPEMLPTMLAFIRDNQPQGTQLILGLENTCDLDFNGSIVELTHKNQLLQESEFASVREELWPRIRAAFWFSEKTAPAFL